MKNKKGFMLAEIIIVSVVIMIGLVSLFSFVSRMFLQYDKRIVYDNVDATYVARGLADNYSLDVIKKFLKGEISDDFFDFVERNYPSSYLQKNNVVSSYLIKYDEVILKKFLSEKKDVIGIKFYEYINNFINSNDFSDSSYVNTNEFISDYDYIIFTSISNNCKDISGIKTCSEDGVDVSFGTFKFNYEVKNLNSSNVENSSNETEGLPVITNVKIAAMDRSFGDMTKVKGFNVTWTASGAIEKNYISIFNSSGTLIKNYETSGSTRSFSWNGSDLPSAGNYYAKVYGSYNGKNGQNECSKGVSLYCGVSNQVTLGKIKIEYGENKDTTVNLSKSSVLYGESLDVVFDPGALKLSSLSILDSSGNKMCNNCNLSNLDLGVGKKKTISLTNLQKDIKISSKSEAGCLAKGTKVLLADGTYKNIEDIDYNDLLMVYDHENGVISYQYPAWIEQSGVNSKYTKVTFSDGTIIKFVNDHGIYSLDYNEYVRVNDNEKFKIGSKVAKILNGSVQEVKVVDIEIVNEKIRYYNIMTTRHLNLITNDILTGTREVFVYNFHGFDENLKWKIPAINDVYAHDEMKEIPYYLYKSMRLYEGKYFEKIGMDNISYMQFLNKVVLNPKKILNPKLNKNGKRQWMVTTSDDLVTEKNKTSYLMEEGNYYILKQPKNINDKKFIGWLHTGENIIYQPGDKVKVLYGTHFIAKYSDLFNNYKGREYFERIK